MFINIKTVNALAKYIAPKDDVRYYLNGILLEITDKARFYAATDGHKMVVIREARQEGDQSGQWILPRDIVLGIKISKRPAIDIAEFNQENGKASIKYCGTETSFGLIEGKFPEWRKVIPVSTSGEIAQFNPDYLVAIRDCAKATVGTDGYCGLSLLHNGSSASLYQANDVNFIAVIMPLRINKADVYSPNQDGLSNYWGFSKPLESVKNAA